MLSDPPFYKHLRIPTSYALLTPSVRRSIPEEVEYELRSYGAFLISNIGRRLKINNNAILLAQVILQYFYMYKPLLVDVRDIAPAVLLISIKMCYEEVHIKDLQIKTLEIINEEDQTAIEPSEGLETNISNKEFEIMELFLNSIHELRLCIPHHYALRALKVLNLPLWCPSQFKLLASKVWNLCNFILRSEQVCRFTPVANAIAAIYLSACDLDIPLKKELLWWRPFGVEDEEFQSCLSSLGEKRETEVQSPSYILIQ